MSDYINLTNLEGLSVNDTVTYDTTTTIDFKGYKVKVEIYGKRFDSTSSLYKDAGYVSFIIDTSLLPTKILTFNKNNLSGTTESLQYTRCDLVYGDETADLYYRIAVAGNAGERYYYSGGYNARGGAGGGLTGQGGARTSSSAVYSNSTGGTQTSGGIAATSSILSGSEIGSSGEFGEGGSEKISGQGGAGGYGWYGGGAGGQASSSSRTNGASGSGGSGFIIGISTTEYPSGYLGDDTELQTTIASAISEGILTQGGSTEISPKMVLTILEVYEETETPEQPDIPEEPEEDIVKNYTFMNVVNSSDATNIDLILDGTLEEVDLSNIKITWLRDYAFYGRSNLRKVILPKGLLTIGKSVFFNCTSLTNIIFNGTIEEWIKMDQYLDWNYNVPATYVQCIDGEVEIYD